MTRAIAIGIFLMLVIAALALSERQHRPQASLPLVETAAPGMDPKAVHIFAPCPLSPHNAPNKPERDA